MKRPPAPEVEVLEVEVAVDIAAAKRGVQRDVAGAPAHELDEADAVHRSLGLHVPRGDRLLRLHHRHVEPE